MAHAKSPDPPVLAVKPAPTVFDRFGIPPPSRGRGRGSYHSDRSSRGGNARAPGKRLGDPPTNNERPSSSKAKPSPLPDIPTLSYSKGELSASVRKAPPSPLKAASLTTPSTAPSSPGPKSHKPTTPRNDKSSYFSSMSTAPIPPSPLSATTHNRSKRGGKNKKHNKDLSATTDNPKPVSIEDAIAQMTTNPFGGGPMKSPRLPPPPRASTSSPAPADPSKPNDPLNHVDKAATALDSVADSHPNELTIVHAFKEAEGSRPHTPSTHIDWAGDDDDGSLPDLDDWVTPQPSAVFKLPENHPSEVDTLEPLHSSSSVAVPTVTVDPPHVLEEAIDVVKDSDATTQEIGSGVSQATGSQPSSEMHPVELGSESVRVALPGSRKNTLIPKEQEFTSNTITEDSYEPSFPTIAPHSAPPLLHESYSEPAPIAKPFLRASPSETSLHRRPATDSIHYQHQRPLSMASASPSRFDRFHLGAQAHSRTRSLPQTPERRSPNHVHSSPATPRARPVISAAGLSRISRSLAPNGLNTPPSSAKAREGGTVVE